MWGIAWVISRMERNPGDRVLLRPGGSDYADSEPGGTKHSYRWLALAIIQYRTIIRMSSWKTVGEWLLHNGAEKVRRNCPVLLQLSVSVVKMS